MNDRVEVALPAAAGAAEPSSSEADRAGKTVVSRLLARARKTPERLAYTWLADGETEAETLTWGALRVRAEIVAHGLRAADLVAGDRALLLFPPGLDFLVGFFGCLLAGVVAVPAYPPRSLRRPEREGERLAGVAADAAPRAVLTTAEIAAAGPALAAGVPALSGLPWLSFSAEAAAEGARRSEEANDTPFPAILPESTAFLQYTSGSTSEPKGVIVSHANLAANLGMIQVAFGQDEDSIVVGWLPLYHDMGLIGNVLQPLWSGGRCVLMSPVSFLQRPARWLEAIARYRATTSGGPDFAYALAARKVTADEAARLDLSSWDLAFSGAEPVRAETLAAFAERMAPSGFRSEAFYPCYGLAEATLFVAGPERGRPPHVEAFDAQGLEEHTALPAGLEIGGAPRPARTLVSCGGSGVGQRLAIVEAEENPKENPKENQDSDPANEGFGRPCPPGRIGEIWVSGPSIAGGYRNRPEANAATFGARLAGSAETYLRTGDLGFVHDGELYVTGRLKDLVILRGRNHYPQDLERTVEAAHPDLTGGGSAAFSIESGEGERLVLVAEVSRHRKAEPEALVEAIRTAIADRHEVQVADVRLLSPGALPKTTSGKVRRGAARAAYLAGGLGEIEVRTVPPVAVAEPGGGEPDALHAAAARVLRISPERLDPTRPLTAQGLDSLTGIEFQLAAQALGVAVSIADLLDGASLEELVQGGGLSWVRGRPARTSGPEARAPRKEAPLTLDQQALWAAERLAPGAYTIAVAARAEDLDTDALVRAVELAVERHPALGALFSAGPDGPIQTFAPPRLETIHAPADSTDSIELSERLATIALLPFDLGAGPLVRLAILEQASGEALAVTFAVHHLVADFASLALLAQEVGAIYAAEVSSRLPKLPPLAEISLADWIVWRNERLATLDRGEGSVFAGRLGALSSVEDLDLPTDRPRPATQTFRGFLRSLPLSPAAALGLDQLARASGSTPFALLAATFSAFLHRWTGQSRFALAAPTSGRTAPGLASLVGYLVQPAAIAIDISPEGAADPSFVEHLRRTRRAVAEAVAAAGRVPFSLLVERLRPRRDPARPPLAQAAVAFEAGALGAFALGIDGAEIDLGGARLSALALAERRVPFELTLHAARAGEALHLALEANTDLFDPATIERALERIGRMLTAAVESPETAVLALPLLSGSERAELIDRWSRAAEPAPALPPLVPAAVWARAHEAPANLAIAVAGSSLSYGELAGRALALAGTLRARGIGRAGAESFVALLAGRSAEAVIGQLAVLWAGAAYLPLDPAHPDERLAYELADSGAALLLAASSECERARRVFSCPVLDLENPVVASPPLARPVAMTAGHAAYAIYTSGSTGRPKAVVVPHGALANLIAWHVAAYGLTPADRTPLLAGPAFDAAVWETWPPLAAGACLLVPEERLRTDPERLPEWLDEAGATVAFLSTPIAEACLSGEWRSQPSPTAPLPEGEGRRMRVLLTGGDRLRQAPPSGLPFALVNHYGPTENAVVATAGEIAPGEGVPSIGRPILGVRAFVLDRRFESNRELAPFGDAGELALGGAGLARGYHGRPDLTAERFVPDPFSGVAGARLYRTGDRVRFRADGALDFLGRIDAQVKIRGQRIELGEIEAALLAEPWVAAATVAVFGVGPEARLAAYVVPALGSFEADRLRARLRAKLPEAMVPSAFVELAALPLTPNGKVDRRALPEPEFDRGAGQEFEPPRSPIEEILAGIFGEVLGVERPIGRHDDLLALGLHSLTAARAAARVTRALGREIPLAALFEAPTIGALADRLTEAGAGGTPWPAIPALPAIVAGGRGDRAPLTLPQRRLWFLERLLPGRATYHVAGAVDLSGDRKEAALSRALEEVVARHDALRTAIPDEEGEPYQIASLGGGPGLSRIDLSALDLQSAESERLSRSLARRPFDLATGPLVRFAEIVKGTTDARLVAIFHHLICDGAALELFLGELWTAYEALAAGRPVELPPVEIQLADVARWQAATVTPERTEEPLAYFRSRLADLEPLDLPGDRPLAARRSGRGHTLAVHFDGDLARRLAARARSAGTTPFMLWVAALQALLARISGRAKTAIGTPVANRRSPELERLFGFVANTLVLDAEMGDDPKTTELIDRVRVGALAAYAREDLPFELLVEALAPRRDLAQNPLFDVLLSFEPPLAARRIGALDLTPVRLDTGTAKLDLSLAVAPSGEGVDLWAEHDAERFDSTTIARWLAGYERLLGALAATAEGEDLRVSDLPLLALEERAQLLAKSSEPAAPATPAGLLHAAFFALAERNPNALAMVAAEGAWTYGELAARALSIASALAARGVEPEERVGVLLHRGTDLVAALLGVLAAGGAYVPLDPAYPEERLRFLLEDSGARICLSESALARLVPAAAVVLLEDLAAETTVDAVPTPGHLAYLIYTSGSTGRPKSVAIDHGTAAGFISWALAAFSPLELSAVLFSTSVCFDLSIFELFAPLSSGGALVLADNALDLPAADGRHPVSLINTVPSALAELVRSHGLPPNVVTVNLAGEALPGALVERIFASSPNVERVNNLYGPSEDTTYSTWCEIRRGADFFHPPIGRPLPGTQSHVVGRRGELSIPGVPGELRLGGAGLARGYLGRPDLTAERFVPDPFSGVPGARLYATGDRVRWIEIDSERPALAYLGRIDHQVKVRGFRIELGEVESALATGTGVREAAAAVVGDGAERRLVGFVAGEVEVPALLAELRGRLPGYLVPSTLTRLDALPRLPNGKIDRKGLPALADQGANSTEYVAPRNETEAALAGVFAEVLGRERVGAFDDFFALGGHSLLAARAAARIARVFGGRDLPLSALFETPTVAGLAAKLDEEMESAAALPPIVAVERPDSGLPLAFAQERLWFLEQLAPGRPTYHLAGAIEIAGRFDARARARFAAALARVVARHEILRTAIRDGGAGPRQIVLPAPPGFFLPLAALDAIPAGRQAEESERLARAFGSLPFDLSRGQTLRALVLRSSVDSHQLAVSLHHAAADGGSLGLLIGEVAEIDSALASDRAPNLPPLPIQFADFSVWQRATLDGDALGSRLETARARLTGLPTLDLPTDRKRPAARSGRGAIRERMIPPALLARLDSRARSLGASRFQALAAAAMALLARLTGEVRIPLGTPVANRPRLELEPLIGMFVNTLVLDVEVGDDPRADELLARTRASALAALALSELPFERLVEEIAPRRDTAQNPLFQVLFVQEEPLAPFQSGDLRLTPRRLDVGTARFDLTLEATPAGEGLEVAAEYDTDLFDAETIDRWLGGYERLLASIADFGERHLSDLTLLSDSEISQLNGWSAGEENLSQPELLHARFFRQAERTPNAPALVGVDETWSYGRLAERALGVAAGLAARGIAPEERVGVLLPRSPELVAAILGVLKAGGVYVPLDPTYPQERLRFLLEDSGPRICLAQRGLESLVPGEAVVLLDDLGEGRKGAFEVAIDPRQLAYLIYTSGSTGRPKSVAIEHDTAAGFVSWALSAFSPDELSAVLFSTSVCFDLSIFELFAPLSSGGALVLADNALDLPAAAGRHPVTLINTVPSALSELVRSAGLPPSVVTVNLAGEALPGTLVDRIFASSPQVLAVNNLYGPSEDTTYSTHARILRTERGSIRADAPPIGRPLAGTRSHVVGRWGERVPTGASGELRLGGAGLARGYLGRPELTAERFVPDPFSGEPGARLYATGDRVRWLPQSAGSPSELSYLGRIDNQVKVRGFRVELGEVETALLACPGVLEAAAAVLGEGGERRLVGYVAGAAGIETAALLADLKSRLPGYLVPSTLAVLEALPRLPNGKVNRKALPNLADVTAESGDVAPRDEIEAALAALFAEVLGRETIGVFDDFFALGGHSLLAVRLAARIRETFPGRAENLPLGKLFAAPTVAALAREIRGSSAARETGLPLIARDRDPAGDPLSFAQERMWFLERLEPGTAVYHLPFVLRLSGAGVARFAAPFAAAIGEILRRHEPLRARFVEVETWGEAGFESDFRQMEIPWTPALGRPNSVDLTALGASRDHEARRVIDHEARRPFAVGRSALLRAMWIALDAENARLAVTLHHLAADGASLALFAEELQTLVATVVSENPAAGFPLPVLPVRYADYAAWQRELWAGGAFEGALAAARTELADAPEGLDLPLDGSTACWAAGHGGEIPIALGTELSARLAERSRSVGATPFQFALSAFAALLARLGQTDDMVIGVPVAGRSHAQVERLIGLFVNTVPVRVSLSGDPSLGALLARSRRAALAGLSRGELPLERLIEDLGTKSGAGRPPLFSVLLTYQPLALAPSSGESQVPGLSIEIDELSTATAKLDLSLSLRETPTGIVGRFEYDAELFAAATIERWAEAYLKILAAGIDTPTLHLSELALLPELEPLLRIDPAARRRGFAERPKATEAVLGGEPLRDAVAEIFAEVLGVPPTRVGAADGFFALGGHSLLASRAMSRIRSTFGVELPLKRLFERPTVAEIASDVAAELDRRRLRLSGVPSATSGAAPASIPPLPALPAGTERPLSLAQERLWFLDRLGAGAAYNLPAAVRLSGVLRPALLGAAIGETVRRHEGLRASFPERDGRPVLTIAPPGAVPLPEVDLSALQPSARAGELSRLTRAEAALPFDLAAGPLLRTLLVKLGAAEHVALFDHHHAISDGWSIGLLLDEIGRSYAALAQGRAPDLPELLVQVADFAAWQRTRLAPGAELDRLLEFWRRELAQVPTVLSLPTDRPRPAVFSARGLAVPVALGAELSDRLEAFGRERGATTFALLAAGFGALLGRWVEPTGKAPLLLGTPIAGRDRPEIERLIGFFANILPLRIDRLGDDGVEGSFAALLGRVRRRSIEAFAHPDLPFERLVEDLVPRRDPSRPPLVQAALNWQAASPWRGARLGDLALEPLPGLESAGAEIAAKFELMLVLERVDSGISGHFEINSDLFERTTALRWADQLRALLAAAMDEPDGTAWGDLAVLSAAERQQMLVEWYAARDERDEVAAEEPAWHERVAAWAVRFPDRPAAFLGDAVLSYGELEVRSRALAARLQALGAAPEDRVAMALDRSFEALIAILGILRAGCAYVALDPMNPAERIAFLLGDSGARALVAARDGFEAFAPKLAADGWGNDLPVLLLDDAPVGPVPPLEPVRFEAEQLAYIVYTSGSTGVPKGVATPHRAVDAYVAAQTALLGIGPDDCMLQFSPLGFDGSVEEIFAPLAAGAALALRGNDLPGARELLRMFAERRVSVVFLPTGYWSQLAAAIAAEDLEIPATLRVVRFGGELGLGDSAREVRRRAPALRLANVYGPTETTVIITDWTLPLPDEIPATLPLGRPMAHARMAVVDGALRPVPRGAVGELVFGGPSLARGYWARPDLAAERFVPDPFGGSPGESGELGARLYRTGDLARLAPDGSIEFLGRAEGAGGQVKLRGFRIELGEIEAALMRHPGVTAAVATVVKKTGNEDRLVAWVAAPPSATGSAPTAADLIASLAARLPAQLIPSAIAVLATLPLNANGKVDRRALPPFAAEPSAGAGAYAPPAGTLEATLAAIWTELFGAAGPDDNFFDLGASSLSLVRLHSRIQADLGREFPLVTLFQHPTLRSLAKSLGEAGTSAAAEREAAEISAARDRSAERREGLAELERRRARARRRL